ncbi:MAG: RNA-binding S4 domain-containing protein [Proteobacteria bacterium]|nr:RNA-binding S4 domain-containing protein [Pseudomonadota bacterium]
MTATQRIDKWLWYARFFKSRSLAAKICEARKVRLNGTVVTKPSHLVKEDDVLTFAQRRGIRVVRIADVGTRRGPAAEAATLYEDLAPPETLKVQAEAEAEPRIVRESGAGRPTKAERRATDRLRGRYRE